MPETSSTKQILFLACFIIALCAVFFLAYNKEASPREVAIISKAIELDAQTSEVKAISKTTTDQQHMALTSENIIWYTNHHRAQHNLNPLTLSIKLRDSAYHKSLDMFKYQYFDHYRPSNHLGFDNFIDNQKYLFIKVGENLAMGDFTTSKEIVDAWMESPNHRRNILDSTYTEIGVSVDYGIMNNHKSALITQHFGKPTTTCPTVNTAIQGSIRATNQRLADIKKTIEQQYAVIEGTDPDTSNYESLIAEYNKFVGTYNTVADQVAVMISDYNKQAAAFDACITRG